MVEGVCTDEILDLDKRRWQISGQAKMVVNDLRCKLSRDLGDNFRVNESSLLFMLALTSPKKLSWKSLFRTTPSRVSRSQVDKVFDSSRSCYYIITSRCTYFVV